MIEYSDCGTLRIFRRSVNKQTNCPLKENDTEARIVNKELYCMEIEIELISMNTLCCFSFSFSYYCFNCQ